jgi:AcrR family transcriptional regulator
MIPRMARKADKDRSSAKPVRRRAQQSVVRAARQLPARRHDAQQNRQRILAAARELFAEQGVEAPYDSIAQAAGVGVATVFRHFPSRARLLAELVAARIEELHHLAEDALAARDPWSGLRDFVRKVGQTAARDRDILSAIWSLSEVPAPRADSELVSAVDQIVARAHAARVLRLDVGPGDIMMLALLPALPGRMPAGDFTDKTELYLDIVLRGLRPSPSR